MIFSLKRIQCDTSSDCYSHVVQNLKDEFMILQHLTDYSQRKAQKKKEKGELQVLEQYTPKVYFYSSD